MSARFVTVALFVLATSWLGAAMLRRLGAARAGERALVMAAVAPGPERMGDAVAAIRGMRADGVTVRAVASGTGRAQVTMTGPEPAVIRAIAGWERGRSPVRFASWRLEPETGTADRVRFEGIAVVLAR